MAKLKDDIDSLFKLPLSEFIGARKALATRVKKDGRADDAEEINSLAKPSVSAWAANQLYWNHREQFDQLIEAGQRFRKAQTSRSSGKVADMRDALGSRREALAELEELAVTLLSDAGHNPSLDTIRRITTTLEAMSAYEDIPNVGRLTKDVDPPGFESLASFIPGGKAPKRSEEVARVTTSKTSVTAAPKTRPRATQGDDTRNAKITAAKGLLQEAKKSLADARVRVQSLEATQKKADAQVKEAEKQRREAEERLKKARAASDDAARRARSVTFEVKTATKAFDEARVAVERLASELELLFKSSK
jgi:hypothetical protein